MEARRIELMPVAPLQKKETKPKVEPPTVRFTLDLTDPSDKQFPEFSYEDLVRNALGKKKKKENGVGPEVNGTNPDDPFGEDEDDVKLRALAQSFEAKYGGPPTKKGKRQRLEDLVDLGEGYDEEDSFIDNTEAYDELVPACLETKHGGFYINAGKLDFKEIRSDSEGDDFESPKKKKKKKKKMSINSDSEEEEKKVLPKKKFSHKNVLIKKRKKLSSNGSLDGNKPQKKVKLGEDGLPKKRGLKHDKEKRRPKIKKTPPTVEELIQQQVKSTTTSNHQQSETTSNANESIVLDASVTKPHSDTSNHAESGEERSKSPKPENAPPIPDHVPLNLRENVEKIKEAAKETQEGKSKFFNEYVNKLLLGIETESQSLTTSTRRIIYTHLAAFLPVGIQALTKRAKKLRLNEQDDKLKEPINRLREAIAKAMPEQMEKYSIEVQEATKNYQEKQQLLQQQKQGQENASTADSDDEKKEGDKNAEMKRFKAPNKKFHWTEELRNLLGTVVRIKMSMYESGNSRSQSAEEYLRAFLDTEIKNLWPQGWMQTRMLYKESKNAHSRWTSLPVQPKLKKPVIPETGLASLNNSQVANTSSSMLDVSGNISLVKTPAPKVEKPPTTHPTPTLLDYASKSYFSSAKSKAASTPIQKTESGIGSSATPTTTTSITTTPAVTPISTSGEGVEALRAMNIFAGLAAASKGQVEKSNEQAALGLLNKAPLVSPPPPRHPLGQQGSTGFPTEGADFMAPFREFTKTFRPDSPPALSIQPASVSEASSFKKNWDQAAKPKDSRPKFTKDIESVTKMKLQSGTVNVVKVTKPKPETSAWKTVTSTAKTTHSVGQVNDKFKGNFHAATSPPPIPSSNKAAPFSHHQSPSISSILSSAPQVAHRSPSGRDNLPVPDSKLKIHDDQKEKLVQLALKAQLSKPVEKKRQQPQQHSYSQEHVIGSSNNQYNNLYPPSSGNKHSPQAAHSNQSMKQVSPSHIQQQQQQFMKQTVHQQQVPRASPSPNRSSPVTPPRSSPGAIYGGLTMAQIQAQTLQQQQRTTAAPNSQSQNMWRPVDHSNKVSRSSGSSSAFNLSSGMQRSPAAVSSDFFSSPPRNPSGGIGTSSSFPGIHMVDLTKAQQQQAHDIAASMRSPSSPAHAGPGLYGSGLPNQGVGLNHHGLLGPHGSPQTHRTQSLYSGVHRGSPLTPGTPPFSSHPYADPGQQYH